MAKINRNDARFEIRLPTWMYEGVTKMSEELELSNNEYARNLIEKDLAKNGIVKPKKTIKTEQE
jgi:hypothetical protein